MLKEIIRVQQILNAAQLHTQVFQYNNHLSCASHCCHCCLKKDLSASPIEFLPLAYHLYKTGKAEDFYNKLTQIKENTPCILLTQEESEKGQCSIYAYRGLICRLFGFTANPDKNSHLRLISCKRIKDTPDYLHLGKRINYAPVFSDFYLQLEAVDFSLANEQLQVNKAIQKAIELVLTYFQFRNHFKRA